MSAAVSGTIAIIVAVPDGLQQSALYVGGGLGVTWMICDAWIHTHSGDCSNDDSDGA